MSKLGHGPGRVSDSGWKGGVENPAGSGVVRNRRFYRLRRAGDSGGERNSLSPVVPGREGRRRNRPVKPPAEAIREISPWRLAQPGQTMCGVYALGNVWQEQQIFKGTTFISIFDRDQKLFAVRPLQSPPPLAVGQARARPAMLLGGERGVTSFVDRDEEITSLTQWYEGADRLSVMLVHGAGGQGKTRLMRQFATIVRGRAEEAQIWEALPFTEVPVHGTSSADDKKDADAALGAILLLVDEADLWPTRKLLQLFRETTTWPCDRIRVLLTARAAGMWWADLRAELSPLEIACQQLRLEPLHAAGIRELAENGGNCFAAALKWIEPQPVPQEVLDELAGSPPLSVELMVLARTYAHHAGYPMPKHLQAAIEVILEKELRYWARMYGMEESGAGEDPHRIHVQPTFMARAVYVATLAGPLGHNEAQLVLRLARIGCNVDTQQVIDDHARCYPPVDGNLWLVPLAPCVAEEFLGMLVPDPTREAGLIAEDSWASDAPFHVLDLMSPQERATEAFEREASAKARVPVPSAADQYGLHTFGPQLERVVLRLVRAALKHPHLANQQLYPLARLYPKAVVLAGGTALTELTEICPALPDDVRKVLEEAATECEADDLAGYQQAIDALQRLAVSARSDIPPAGSAAAGHARSGD